MDTIHNRFLGSRENETMRPPARRQVLVTALVIGSLALSGCLTYNPSVTMETTDSTVFDTISVTESWASGRVRATAHLTSSPAAGNVTQITVIRDNGETFSTRPVDPGQTTVILHLPPNQNATLVASDTINGTTLATLNVTTSGNTLF
jgi:quinol monooxygenase YgiN